MTAAIKVGVETESASWARSKYFSVCYTRRMPMSRSCISNIYRTWNRTFYPF